jgi:hypothetical protein
MTAHGVLEDDLNPAFLMLSGCETDLWKRTMGQQPGESLEHYNRSQRWLQKVYGTQRPLPQPTAVPEVQVSDDSHSGPDAEVNPKATNTVPVRAEVEASTPDDRQSNTASVPNTTEYPTETSLTLMPAPTHTPATASSISASRLPMLECEVKSLRKRQESQAVTIDNMQSLKRKVEADYSSERSLRRKLERHLDDLNKELNLARRSETHALEQLKREVETRRRAEENLSIERDRRREVEKLSEQRMVKPLYEDLAHMFQRAAQGDELAFTSYSAGTAHSSTPFSYGA